METGWTIKSISDDPKPAQIQNSKYRKINRVSHRKVSNSSRLSITVPRGSVYGKQDACQGPLREQEAFDATEHLQLYRYSHQVHNWNNTNGL